MDADLEVIAGDAGLHRLFSNRAWRWLPPRLRGFALLVMRPWFALRVLGRIAQPYVAAPRVLVAPQRLEVHDGGRIVAVVPSAFKTEPLYGGGARVIATLADDSTLELPLGELTVAEAEELAVSLSQRVRLPDGSYR